MLIFSGLSYASLIAGGYKQSCSIDPHTQEILNPYVNYADPKCSRVLSTFPMNKFGKGCLPWSDSGVESGDASWFFKADCVKL